MINLIPYLSHFFAESAAFIGKPSHILQAAGIYYARIREIDLKLKPQESIIYIPNRDSFTVHHLPLPYFQQ